MRFFIWVFLVVACSSTTPEPHEADGASATPMPNRESGGPRIHAEVGALDEEKVNEAFAAARPAIDACFEGANSGLRYKVVGGEVEVMVRVKQDGSVRWVYPSRSTLGHAETERCILSALEQQSWPRPEGGEEGIASTNYAIEPPGRPAVEWSPGDLGDAGATLESRLRGCLSGGGSMSVTVYVDPDGRAFSAGAAVEDEAAIDALECAVSAAREVSYPSPGSYPAKVTLQVP